MTRRPGPFVVIEANTELTLEETAGDASTLGLTGLILSLLDGTLSPGNTEEVEKHIVHKLSQEIWANIYTGRFSSEISNTRAPTCQGFLEGV